jgi:hypothetical protein
MTRISIVTYQEHLYLCAPKEIKYVRKAIGMSLAECYTLILYILWHVRLEKQPPERESRGAAARKKKDDDEQLQCRLLV